MRLVGNYNLVGNLKRCERDLEGRRRGQTRKYMSIMEVLKTDGREVRVYYGSRGGKGSKCRGSD